MTLTAIRQYLSDKYPIWTVSETTKGWYFQHANQPLVFLLRKDQTTTMAIDQHIDRACSDPALEHMKNIISFSTEGKSKESR